MRLAISSVCDADDAGFDSIGRFDSSLTAVFSCSSLCVSAAAVLEPDGLSEACWLRHLHSSSL